MPRWHEVGGAAANAGVQIHEIGQGGRFSADELRAAVKPRNFAIFPTTTLVEVENTHNRAGGVVVPQDEARAHLCRGARARAGDASSTAPGSGTRASPAACRCASWRRRSTSVAVAFSKGLGAPGGSLLAGSKETIAAADRHRRRMGGAMRQNGIFSAAALYAIDHHLAAAGRRPSERATARRTPAPEPDPVRLDLATSPDQHRRLPSARSARHRCADAQRERARARRPGQRLRPAYGARRHPPRRDACPVRARGGRARVSCFRMTPASSTRLPEETAWNEEGFSLCPSPGWSARDAHAAPPAGIVRTRVETDRRRVRDRGRTPRSRH